MSREIPVHTGAARLVLPITVEFASSAGGLVQLGGSVQSVSRMTKTPGCSPLAIIATSGMSRTPSFGTPSPVWNAGLVVKTWLRPPPVALFCPAFDVLLSFHANSETDPTSFPFPSNSGVNPVPPTEVVRGLAESSLTFGTPSLHISTPSSPDATKTDCPCSCAFAKIVPSVLVKKDAG